MPNRRYAISVLQCAPSPDPPDRSTTMGEMTGTRSPVQSIRKRAKSKGNRTDAGPFQCAASLSWPGLLNSEYAGEAVIGYSRVWQLCTTAIIKGLVFAHIPCPGSGCDLAEKRSQDFNKDGKAQVELSIVCGFHEPNVVSDSHGLFRCCFRLVVVQI
jgi:hypothetical protein